MWLPYGAEKRTQAVGLGALETVKKVVIPISSAHSSALRAGFRRLRYATVSGRSGLGDPPVKRNIFDSKNIGFPEIWGIARR